MVGTGQPAATTVVAVAPGDAPGYDAFLSQFFTRVQPVATLSNPAGIRNQEWHGRIYLDGRLRAGPQRTSEWSRERPGFACGN